MCSVEATDTQHSCIPFPLLSLPGTVWHHPLPPSLLTWPGETSGKSHGPVSEAFAEAVADGVRSPNYA